MDLSGQDSVHLFVWKNQTHENQRPPISSQAGEVYARVTGRVPGCLSPQARQYRLQFSLLFPGPVVLFNLRGHLSISFYWSKNLQLGVILLTEGKTPKFCRVSLSLTVSRHLRR